MSAIEHDRGFEFWSGPAVGAQRTPTARAERAIDELDPPIASLEIMAARTEIARYRAGEIAEPHLQNTLRRLAFDTFVAAPLRRLIAHMRRRA